MSILKECMLKQMHVSSYINGLKTIGSHFKATSYEDKDKQTKHNMRYASLVMEIFLRNIRYE